MNDSLTERVVRILRAAGRNVVLSAFACSLVAVSGCSKKVEPLPEEYTPQKQGNLERWAEARRYLEIGLTYRRPKTDDESTIAKRYGTLAYMKWVYATNPDFNDLRKQLEKIIKNPEPESIERFYFFLKEEERKGKDISDYVNIRSVEEYIGAWRAHKANASCKEEFPNPLLTSSTIFSKDEFTDLDCTEVIKDIEKFSKFYPILVQDYQQFASDMLSVLGMYQLREGELPKKREGIDVLVGKGFERLPVDEWGTPFCMEVFGTKTSQVRVFSAGPDKKAGTSDDIQILPVGD